MRYEIVSKIYFNSNCLQTIISFRVSNFFTRGYAAESLKNKSTDFDEISRKPQGMFKNIHFNTKVKHKK